MQGVYQMETVIKQVTIPDETIGEATSRNVYMNLTTPALIEQAIKRHEGKLASNGALVAYTGKRTGRSPKDRFIVRNSATEALVNWGPTNQPVTRDVYEALRNRMMTYLEQRDIFVLDARVGADVQTTLPIRVITEYAWHSLFARQLFIRLTEEELETHNPEWVVISAPSFKADPERDGVISEVAVMLNFQRCEVLICGTEYAGEIKKSIFSVLNFMLPRQGILPMHCAANQGPRSNVALFFGLSGTGKTSLSSDPERRLIGDDEHGWGEDGIVNVEGACYAKCIRLSAAHEPEIYNAIRFGSVVENVDIHAVTHLPDYDSERFTENTRAAYPLEYIENVVTSSQGGHPDVIFFLTADAFGVLPPIARLTPEQAAYYFLSGYTAKLAGTEVGVSDPQTTFEAWFGAPFLPLPATVYANMLREKLTRFRSRVYLLNTGWSGGPFGVGKRISIEHTRALVRAAILGQIEEADIATGPIFGLHVPREVKGVPSAIMSPRQVWANKNEYDRLAKILAHEFIQNFNDKFAATVPELAEYGPNPEKAANS